MSRRLPNLQLLSASFALAFFYATPAYAQDCDVEEIVSAALLANTPSSVPQVPDNQAGTNAGSLAQISDGAERTSLLALALDAGIIDATENVKTISLAPVFSFLALRDPSLLQDQGKYADYFWARRLGLKLSAGGTGESLDQDGDGTLDDALVSSSASDVLSYELSWQIGSRDRRDRENYRRLIGTDQSIELKNAMSDLSEQFSAIATIVINSVDDESCTQRIAALSKNAQFKVQLEKVRVSQKQLFALYDQAVEKIEAKPIFRLVAQGLERDTKFGGDRKSIGVRASKGLADVSNGGSNHDFQLDYLQNELPDGSDELEGWKLGYRYSTAVLRNTSSFGGKGLLFSASATVEKYSDVPATSNDTIAKLGISLSFKAGENVKVPLSLTWANRTELLKDEKEVIAHIGFSIDYTSLFGF